MKHLIDEREPITTDDITQAQIDAHQILASPAANEIDYDVFRRLLAIVDNSYGWIEDGDDDE